MKINKLLLIVGVTALLAACSEPEPPREPAEIVAERAQARWNAMVEQDFQAAWALYTPGFREQLPAGDFAAEMRRRPVTWTAAEVLEVKCAGDEPRCEVRTRVDYKAPANAPGVGSLTGKRGVTEIWLQIGGKWWYSADA
ncbi:MAG: nuclear transport factor 2 family protein [Wenzhouxiangellaceae bacterium]